MRDSYNLPEEGENKGENKKDEFKSSEAKKTPVSKPKTKYKVVSVNSAFIYISYIVDGVTYGAHIEREKSHGDVKSGDYILL